MIFMNRIKGLKECFRVYSKRHNKFSQVDALASQTFTWLQSQAFVDARLRKVIDLL
jgi:hypothetical protein